MQRSDIFTIRLKKFEDKGKVQEAAEIFKTIKGSYSDSDLDDYLSYIPVLIS